MSSTAEAVTLGLSAAAVWGASDFSGGFVTRRSSPAYIVAIAHGVSLLFILALVPLLHPAMPNRLTVVSALVGGGAGGIGLLLLYEALSVGSMGLTSSVAGVVTAILPVIASFFRDGRPTPLRLAGFAVAMTAIWLISWSPGSKSHPRGIGLAVLAGIGFGVLLILLRTAGSGSVLWAMAFSRCGGVGCALVASVFVRLRPGAVRIPWRGIVPLAILAGALDTLGNLLYTLSALYGRLDVAAVLSSLYPAGTILLAVWLLRERATRTQTAGMALALAAVVLISL
nr:DMT family transporter [Paracidobacterium acidisoli]